MRYEALTIVDINPAAWIRLSDWTIQTSSKCQIYRNACTETTAERERKKSMKEKKVVDPLDAAGGVSIHHVSINTKSHTKLKHASFPVRFKSICNRCPL